MDRVSLPIAVVITATLITSPSTPREHGSGRP